LARANGALLLLIGLVGTVFVPATDGDAASRGYHDKAAVRAKLETLAENEAASLTEIGRSAGDHPIWVMTVAGEGPVPPERRPALFIGANMAGYHNTGTEAALAFLEFLLGAEDAAAMRRDRVVYVAPILNPDAHDAFFGSPRVLTSGNATAIDHDLDGFLGEDDVNDLNGDGMITKLRIADPMGTMVADEENPPAMRRADPKKGERGLYLVLEEGDDDDGDGRYNEDAVAGATPALNFAHAFPYDKRESGLWAGYLPESKAIMDFLLARRHIAAAVVFGPANNLLSPPKSVGGGADPGSQKYSVPPQAARIIGLDPEQKYTIDEVWEKAKTHPIVVQQDLTKDDVAQFLGVGPATSPSKDDMAIISALADAYEKRLEEAGLDKDRDAGEYEAGGFTPWLYYQYGAFAIELDVWGIPKAPKPEAEGAQEAALSIEKLEKMSSEEFLEIDKETIAAFLKENKVPEQYNADAVIGAVKAGQLAPPQMAGMLRQMGAGGGDDKGEDDKPKGSNDLLVFAAEHAPWALVDYSPVKLEDGRSADVFGVDPFIRYNPPHDLLETPIEVHTQTIVQLSEQLATVKIADVTVTSVGRDVWRVRAVAVNEGMLATHTGLAKKAKTHLPVRMGFTLPDGVTRIHGPRWATSEQMAGKTGRLQGEWLVRGKKGTTLELELHSDQAGRDRRTITLTEGGAR